MQFEMKRVLPAAVALFVGVGTGVLTVFGQKYLPGSLNSLANSGAVWLIPAFFAARCARTRAGAVLTCIATLILCVLSYYAGEAVVNRHSFSPNFYFYLWLACGTVFGPVFGFGAHLHREKGAHAHIGAALLPAVFLSEGLSQLIHIGAYRHMVPAVVGRIVVGLLLSAILFRREVLRKKPILSLAALTLLGVLGFEIIFRLTT